MESRWSERARTGRRSIRRGPGQESGGLQGVRELSVEVFQEGGQNKVEARPPRASSRSQQPASFRVRRLVNNLPLFVTVLSGP